MFQSLLVLTLFLWHCKNSFLLFSCLYCTKAWVISFNSLWFWLWLYDEVLYLELLSDPSFWHIRSNLGSCAHQWKMDDAKYNHSISEAKYNESWKSVLPPTLDPKSSTASDEIFNHFEMIISCRRRTLVQFYDQMSSTFTGQLLHQMHSEVTCFFLARSALEEMFVLMMWMLNFSLRVSWCSVEQACTVLLICNANHCSLN